MKRACVIGWPIEHSRSPLIHGYWLKQYGIDGAYTKEAGAAGGGARLPALARGAGLRRLQRDGAAQGDRVHAGRRARCFGPRGQAAQYLVARGWKAARRQHRHLRLHDAISITRCRTGKPMTVRCACSAPAVPRAPSSTGFSRRAATRCAFSTARGSGPSRSPRLSGRASRRSTGTTAATGRATHACWSTRPALGMKGGGSLDMDFAGFNEDCVVSDIVYVPLETQLLAQARAHGLRDCRWPRHAAASGGAGLREMVRRASRGHRRAARSRRRRHRGPLMLIVGLTGSIGMGKSTAAAHLRARGHCRCSTPTPRCTGSTPGRSGGADRARVPRHDEERQRRSREAERRAGRRPRIACASSRRSCIRWCATPSVPFCASMPSTAPRSRCWRSRCCSRPAPTRWSTRPSSSARRPRCSARGAAAARA